MFFNIGFLQNFTTFTAKQPLFNKVKSLKACNFIGDGERRKMTTLTAAFLKRDKRHDGNFDGNGER